MPRKPRKGYFVRGQFVAEGSELDLELKRELKGGLEVSKTDLKRESAQLQSLGEQLLVLRSDLLGATSSPGPACCLASSTAWSTTAAEVTPGASATLTTRSRPGMPKKKTVTSG